MCVGVCISMKRDSVAQQERDAHTLNESATRKQLRMMKRSAVPAIEKVSQSFIQTVCEGPDYTCNCCHRLMYRKTVKKFSCDKYTKMSGDLLRVLFPPESELVSAETRVWICKTCDYTLKRGKMPAQAKANNMDLVDIPAVLSDLNPMEVRLISLRIPFMKMVALPCGKQRAIHGPAVNVPTDLHHVCTLLPRLPSQAQVVPMKIKRKLCYKGHYMYEYVRPAKGLAALEWLKENNPLYGDITINSDWQADAAEDDADLWDPNTVSCPCPHNNNLQLQEQTQHQRNVSIYAFKHANQHT